jgi:hypothetical protein
MARGFESKSTQDHQLEAENARAERPKEKVGREEIERRKQRESLEMSRMRITRELEATRSENRRQQLRAALEYLEDALKKLG